MNLRLLVKGDAVGFKRCTKDGKDLDELVCVNPVSVKVKYAQGRLVEARQTLSECRGDLGAKAAAEPAACIIPPQAIEEQAKAKTAADAKLKAAFEGGQIADLNTLTLAITGTHRSSPELHKTKA